MLTIDKNLGNRCKSLYIAVCDELAKKIPEKETTFRALQREATDYPNFPIVTNLGDIVADYYDILSDDTIKNFIQLRAL